MTCTACISTNGVEALRFFDEGGTKNEMYAEYFDLLLKAMVIKYPKKKLVIVQDNLWAHKTTMVYRLLNK